MDHFDPQRHVQDCSLIFEADGTWPSFHDAEVYTVNIWHGDLRPDEDVWIGPQVDVTLGLSGLRAPTPVAVVKLRFIDCDAIELDGFSYGGATIYEIDFSFEERGFYQDGITPLPPYIWVAFSFGQGVKPLLKFRCFSVTALDRYIQTEPPYA